ncbi:MAG: CoA ester lyase [Anaerolineales bacterium]|nr:CoA ester lyase [Anaerolineales bacterium]
MRSRRALLYIPGDDRYKINKAGSLQADSVCMDMEDGVAANRKLAARQTIGEALTQVDFGRSERLVRINPVGSGLEADDLAAVLPAHPEGVIIPKVEQASQVQWVSAQLAAAESQSGWPAGGIALLVVVETALGILNLREIATADPRLEGLIFGSEDLAGDIGAIRTPQAWEVFYARSALVTHAAAFGLQAIDMVFINFKDPEGLRQEALQGAQLGYAGKQIIHPSQIQITQEAFIPTAEAIAYAQTVVKAFQEHQQAGAGAFALEGKMIDLPIVKSAERVLQRARAAGIVV